MESLRKFIKNILEESFLVCEVSVKINDEKKRGFADELGQMYKEILKPLKPIKIQGNLNSDMSLFLITLANGDTIQAQRNVNPAYGTIKVNGGDETLIRSSELFQQKFPELIKKYYLISRANKSLSMEPKKAA